jgi:type VI secretion system protein ImpM
MPAGLFGKLPAKRDFIATMAPRRFLDAWEPWLQTSLAASRYALGASWSDYYNRAPLWRFWLGPGLCGDTTVGVVMSSVDGVGRAFPLTLLSTGNELPPPPPEIESNDKWFEAAEALLLSALDSGASFEQLAGAAAALPAPALLAADNVVEGIEELPDRAVVARVRDAHFGEAFERSRRFGGARYDSLSFWWTIGGEGFPPIALSVAGLPSAERFADMLTGAFGVSRTDGGGAHEF